MSNLSYNPAAVWISHSALEEFFRCPKSYYYRYLYTNSAGARVTIADPNLTLGIAVDDVIKYYFSKHAQVSLEDLLWHLDFVWKLKKGKAGGFISEDQEKIYLEKAKKFITTFFENIGQIKGKVEVPEFIQMSLSEEEDVRLCGSPDLINYLPDGTVEVIDIKTSEKEYSGETLQLPIYTILIEKELGKKVSKASYWYLNVHNSPKEVTFSDQDFLEDIKFKTQVLLKARKDNDFKCLKGSGGCFKCQDYEYIKTGQAEIVGKDKKRVVYFVDRNKQSLRSDDLKATEPLYSDDLPF